MSTLYSIIESPAHPQFSSLYAELGIDEIRLTSMRKAISRLKLEPPDFVVAEFFYGFGNNYAGVNVSNLDVFLYSLQKYAPQAKVIVLVEKAERKYIEKLPEIVPLHAVLTLPVDASVLRPLLEP